MKYSFPRHVVREARLHIICFYLFILELIAVLLGSIATMIFSKEYESLVRTYSDPNGISLMLILILASQVIACIPVAAIYWWSGHLEGDWTIVRS